MRIITRALQFAIVVGMSTLAVSQTLTPPQAITDPKQIAAKPDAEVEQGEESLSLSRLYMTRLVGDTAWSPDGKTIVFVSNITGRNNLWLVSSEGGWPTQLTVSDQRQARPTWSPDGKWIAYQSDYDGDEQWDIFRLMASPSPGAPMWTATLISTCTISCPAKLLICHCREA